LVSSQSDLSSSVSIGIRARKLASRTYARKLASVLGPPTLGGLAFGTADLVRVCVSNVGWVGTSSALAILGLWLCFGQVVGVGLWLIRQFAAAIKPRLPRRVAWQTLPALLAGGLTLLLARKVLSGAGISRTSVASWGTWVLPLAVTVTAWAALLIAERLVAGRWKRASRAATVVLALALSAGTLVLDATAPGGYLYVHVLLLTTGIMLAIEAAALLSLPVWIGYGALFAAVVTLPSLLAFPSSSRARELLAQPSWAGLQLVDYMQSHLDFDHDGYSRAFGGGDCDDSNASVFPGAPERAGDSLDSNCDGSDEPKHSSLRFEPFRTSGTSVASEISTRARRYPTVVILIDALRFDRVGDPQFRNLALLARESLQFTRVYATSASTSTSLPAMMTGQVRAASTRPTLAESLERHGQRSAFIAPDVVLHHLQGGGPSDPLRGFAARTAIPTDHGDGWGGGETTPTSDTITASAMQILDSPDPPELLWLHYFDVHQWAVLKADGIQAHDDPSRYDAVLRLLDASLRPLVERRERVNLVLLADHGEGLGSRGVKYHTTFAFEELAHVPFLVRVPGSEPAIVPVPVSGTGLFNTVLALRGVEPDASADQSLLELVGVDAPGPGPGFAGFEQQQWSFLYGHHRLLYIPRVQLLELYDVALNPGEQTNLIEAEPHLAAEMRHRLLQLRNELPQ